MAHSLTSQALWLVLDAAGPPVFFIPYTLLNYIFSSKRCNGNIRRASAFQLQSLVKKLPLHTYLSSYLTEEKLELKKEDMDLWKIPKALRKKSICVFKMLQLSQFKSCEPAELSHLQDMIFPLLYQLYIPGGMVLHKILVLGEHRLFLLQCKMSSCQPTAFSLEFILCPSVAYLKRNANPCLGKVIIFIYH